MQRAGVRGKGAKLAATQRAGCTLLQEPSSGKWRDRRRRSDLFKCTRCMSSGLGKHIGRDWVEGGMAQGDVHKMVRKWTHGGAEPISSFPRDMLSQEYKSLLTAGAWALAGRPRGIGALGCVCVVCGLCVQGLRGLRISMVLVLSECFHPSGNSSCSSSLPTGLRRVQGHVYVWCAGWIRWWGMVVNGRVIDQRRGHLIPRCPKLGSLTSNTQCLSWGQTQCAKALPFQPRGGQGVRVQVRVQVAGGQGEYEPSVIKTNLRVTSAGRTP